MCQEQLSRKSICFCSGFSNKLVMEDLQATSPLVPAQIYRFLGGRRQELLSVPLSDLLVPALESLCHSIRHYLGTGGLNSLFNFSKPEQEVDLLSSAAPCQRYEAPPSAFPHSSIAAEWDISNECWFGLPLQTNLTALSTSSHSVPGSVQAEWGFEQPDLEEDVPVYGRGLERDDL